MFPATSVSTLALIESGYGSRQQLHSASLCSASESDSPSRLAHLVVSLPHSSIPSASSCSSDRQPPVSILRSEHQHHPFEPHLSCSHLSLLLQSGTPPKDNRLCRTLVSVPYPYSGFPLTPQRTPSNSFTLDGRGRRERSQSVATGEDRGLPTGVSSYGGRAPGVRWGDRASPQTLNRQHQRQQEVQLSLRGRRSASLASQSSLSLSDRLLSTDGDTGVRLTTASSMLDCQNGNEWSTRCHDDRKDDDCHGDRLPPQQSSPKLPTGNGQAENRLRTRFQVQLE